MLFDPLQCYAQHVMNSRVWDLRPPAGGCYESLLTKGLYCTVIDRQGQFQAELIVIPPKVKRIETHVHPGIDTYELHLTGDFVFHLDGYDVRSTLHTGGTLAESNHLVSVPQDMPHAGTFTTGGSFISFQHYLDGEPSTVSSSYVMVK